MLAQRWRSKKVSVYQSTHPGISGLQRVNDKLADKHCSELLKSKHPVNEQD